MLCMKNKHRVSQKLDCGAMKKLSPRPRLFDLHQQGITRKRMFMPCYKFALLKTLIDSPSPQLNPSSYVISSQTYHDGSRQESVIEDLLSLDGLLNVLQGLPVMVN